jgi:HTH-type transcriptional regulator / antitoxin HigA
MIANEKQYKISRAQAASFEQAVKEFNELSLIEQGLDPLLIKAQRNALVSQLEELQKEVTQYEALKSGAVRQLSTNTVAELGKKLIEARIAQSLSQKELAERLDMKEQQIQRYEQERYSSASLARLVDISSALDVGFQLELTLSPPDARADERSQPIELAKLPISLMKKRNWLGIGKRSVRREALDISVAVRQFMSPAIADGARALLRQGTRLEATFDEHALLAWKARIIWKARRKAGEIGKASFDDRSWLSSFKEFSLNENGPALAVEFLRTKGILVLIEAHLPQTHLDGAALLVDQTVPTIALTLRHNRLDNFWFVLLHELGHVVLHRNTGLKRGFFDDDQITASEIFEREADEFAKSLLLPEESWRSSLVRFTQSPEQIISFAQENRLSPAIVAGWIRRERGDYKIFGDLVGRGKVRGSLERIGLLEDSNVGGS